MRRRSSAAGAAKGYAVLLHSGDVIAGVDHQDFAGDRREPPG